MSDLKTLCEEYDRLDAIVTQKKNEVEQALKARSNCVETIAKAAAPKKRIIRNGREITIVDKKGTWFFRGAKSGDAVHVE